MLVGEADESDSSCPNDGELSVWSDGHLFNFRARENPFAERQLGPIQRESIFSTIDPGEGIRFQGSPYSVNTKENPFTFSENGKKNKLKTKLANIDLSMINRVKGDDEESLSPSLILRWEEESFDNKEKPVELSAFFIDD